MNVAAESAFFSLKSAQSYRFYKRLGQQMVDARKGQVLEAKTQADIDYFRARPDVVDETNAHGTPLSRLGQGEINQDKAVTYQFYGRNPPPQPTQPVAQASSLPSLTDAPPSVPGAVPYQPAPGTAIVGAAPVVSAVDLPIPPDPLKDVPLPSVAAAVPVPYVAPVVAPVATAPAVATVPVPKDPYADLSLDQKAVMQKQRLAAGMAPDPNLPLPPENASPMIAALEAAIVADPASDALKTLLMTAKQTELAQLQRIAAGGTHNIRNAEKDAHIQPDAHRGSLLAELQMNQQTGRMDSPVEFANSDGTTDKLSPR